MTNIPIPREIQIRYGIQPGSVYLIQREHDKKEHFFVVLNHTPHTDDEVLLVGATTQHLKERQFIETWEFDEDTLVVIEDGRSSIITKKSTFNCNRYMHRTINEMCASVDFKRLEYTGHTIEEGVLRELREATLRSPRLARKFRPCLGG